MHVLWIFSKSSKTCSLRIFLKTKLETSFMLNICDKGWKAQNFKSILGLVFKFFFFLCRKKS